MGRLNQVESIVVSIDMMESIVVSIDMKCEQLILFVCVCLLLFVI